MGRLAGDRERGDAVNDLWCALFETGFVGEWRVERAR
jgi:hypothetical protein